MKHHAIQTVAALIGASALSGCLGTTPGLTLGELVYQSFDEVGPLADTATMPTTGTASYEGGSIVTVGRPDDPDHMLVGRTTLDADFAAGSLTGQISEIQGKRDASGSDWMTLNHPGIGSPAQYQAVLDTFSDATGDIDITGGFFVGSDLVADIAGTVTSSGDTIRTEGSITGTFKGPDAEAVRLQGDTARAFDAMVVTLNGATASATLDGAVQVTD
ncbi:MAG: hypothetical protein HOY44_03690 [Maritimibacter sp.]|uniref:hypothetical protein n=1 Tax=Maritimibacter sp. TaxID=2003363 RepID=UPI001D2BF093|nr:hypothetical protein [Maritimibacter sp.]MBL6426605.1 hypothetical protein [Maritimibacter sp.]